MTDDKPTDDGPTDGRLGPDEPAPEPDAPAAAPARPGRGGRTVRTGALLLILLGVLGTVLGGFTAASPEVGVCQTAVAELDDLDDPPLDPDEVDCTNRGEREQAIAAADEANGDDDLPSEGSFRARGVIAILVGLIQVVGAFVTLRYRTKRGRLIALTGAAFGIFTVGLLLFPVGLLMLLFSVYALLFSADARAIFGEPGGPRFLQSRR